VVRRSRWVRLLRFLGGVGVVFRGGACAAGMIWGKEEVLGWGLGIFESLMVFILLVLVS